MLLKAYPKLFSLKTKVNYGLPINIIRDANHVKALIILASLKIHLKLQKDFNYNWG